MAERPTSHQSASDCSQPEYGAVLRARLRARVARVPGQRRASRVLSRAHLRRLIRARQAVLALETTFELLGFASYELLALPHLLTPLLFAGPLYVSYLDLALPFQRAWSWQRSVMPVVATWEGIRNYIVVRSVVACALRVSRERGKPRECRARLRRRSAFGPVSLPCCSWEASSRAA